MIEYYVSDQTQTGGVFQRTKSKYNRSVGRRKPNDAGKCLPAVVQRKHHKNLLHENIYMCLTISEI